MTDGEGVPGTTTGRAPSALHALDAAAGSRSLSPLPTSHKIRDGYWAVWTGTKLIVQHRGHQATTTQFMLTWTEFHRFVAWLEALRRWLQEAR